MSRALSSPRREHSPLPEWSPSLREQQQSQRCCDNIKVLWPELTSNFPVSSQQGKKDHKLFYSFSSFNAGLKTDEGESIPRFRSLQTTPSPPGRAQAWGSLRDQDSDAWQTINNNGNVFRAQKLCLPNIKSTLFIAADLCLRGEKIQESYMLVVSTSHL